MGDDVQEQAIVRLLQDRSAIGESAGYRLNDGGRDMQALAARLARLDLGSERKPTWLVLTSLADLKSAMEVERDLRSAEEALAPDITVVSRALYRQITGRPGPLAETTTGFGPAIQFGTFSMQSPEDEWDLADWYETLRLPEFSRVNGAIRVRRYVSVAGPAKFAVLYEFDSLQSRLDHFERPMEAHALNDDHPTGRIVARTIHAPMSPSIGQRVAGKTGRPPEGHRPLSHPPYAPSRDCL